MTAFFEYQIKGGVILALAVIIYQLFLSNDNFFYRNRVWLLSSLFIPWIVPLLAMPMWVKLLVFGEEKEVVSAAIPIVIQQIDQSSLVDATSKNTIDWELLGIVAYVFISFVLLLRLLWGYQHVLRLRRQDAGFRYKGCKVVVLKDKHSSPFSFFRTIFVPKDLDDRGDKHLVMEHERTHCSQWHSVDLSLAEWLLVIHWWNPFAWWLRKLITYNHEYCVDKTMLRKTPEPKQYQYSLLDLLPGRKRMQLVNNFNQSITKKRIVMMNKSNTNQVAAWMKGIFIGSITIMGLLAFTNPDKTTVTIEKQSQTEVIKTEKDLRHYLARSIKYPLEAVYNNVQGEVVAHFSVDENGEAGRPVIGEAVGKDVVQIDEVIVTAYNRRSSLDSSSKEEEVLSEEGVAIEVKGIPKQAGLSLLEKEVERLLTDLPVFVDPSMQGRIIQMRLKFVLQDGKGEERVTSKDNTIGDVRMKNSLGETIALSNMNGKIQVKGPDQDLPSFFIDGEPADLTEIEQLEVADVSHIDAISPQKAKGMIVGEPQNGAILISTNKHASAGKPLENPLYVVDGEIVSEEEFKVLPVQRVEQLSVLKEKTAIDKYGEKGKNGVVEIQLKGEATVNSSDSIRIGPMVKGRQPLYVVNGEEVPDLSGVEKDNVESVSVLKAEAAKSLYGDRAKDGVIIITLKDEAHKKASGEIIIESADSLHYNQSQDAVRLFGDVRIKGLGGESSPLFIINGETSQGEDLQNIDADTIESVSIIKGEQAIAKYGEEAINGVVLIELKTE